jgi:fatty-acyl-CoA synthase
MTAPIERDPRLTLPVLIDRLADRFEATPALVSKQGCLSYRSVSEAANRCTRWALGRGLAAGDVVCLLMPNCVEYMPIWLGLTRIGVTVSLLNTNLSGAALIHSIKIVASHYVIAAGELCDRLSAVRAQLPPTMQCYAHGPGAHDMPRLDQEIAGISGEKIADPECEPPSLADRALYIYTSGTTGLPKAANVSHHRLMQWSHWFAGMMDVRPGDRMYDCLPLYHSVGGVVATGATIVGGGTVVLRERFSARDFWQDIVEERCTLFQYIGELCRYLVNTPHTLEETLHALRLCCGNGLRGDVWQQFQSRFRIPQILEYYASTEGSFSLYNCEGRPGAIGKIPAFLRHRVSVALIKIDMTSGEPLRDETGACSRCGPGEVGEALGEVSAAAGAHGGRFEGYADDDASRRKILRNVFAPGDTWYRTGDLMRRDAQGFFYFVDRLGDTFRWKGENVSTTEVASVLSSCTGIAEAVVYGVAVPGTEGRAGMAALVVNEEFDLAGFRQQLAKRLPDYARPLFVRIASSVELTSTFKVKKHELSLQGYDPTTMTDELYFDNRSSGTYVRLDAALHERIRAGEQRV